MQKLLFQLISVDLGSKRVELVRSGYPGSVKTLNSIFSTSIGASVVFCKYTRTLVVIALDDEDDDRGSYEVYLDAPHAPPLKKCTWGGCGGRDRTNVGFWMRLDSTSSGILSNNESRSRHKFISASAHDQHLGPPAWKPTL